MAGPRTVLTTGANSGLGLAVAIDLAAHGFRSVGSVRSEAKAAVVAHAAADVGVDVETVLLDVDDTDACRRVIDELRPDALVNNAGFLVYGPIEAVPDEEVRALFETLAVAPMRLARLALPHMRHRGWGRIVNVSSLAGRVSAPMLGWYSAAKHALEAASDAMRMEVASAGVAVVLIEPGLIATNIFRELDRDEARFRREPYDRAFDRFRAELDMSKRMALPPQLAARVVRGALRARAPHARYLVGLDATLLARTTVIPTPVRDRITRAGFGL